MHKHLKTFHELHHTHKITHKVVCLIIFAIFIILAVSGLKKVEASLSKYIPVPNGPVNVCYKSNTDYNDEANHVSCTTREKVCQTNYGVLVGCQSKRPIDFK